MEETRRDPEHLKGEVEAFWSDVPCGTAAIPRNLNRQDYFRALRSRRFRLEWFIPRFADFGAVRGLKVLEVGVGAGSDFVTFIHAGGHVFGIDLTLPGAKLAREHAHVVGGSGFTVQGDAEVLPFSDDTFDYVYSWGVIHHTPDTVRAASELVRVLRPGGRLTCMIYHRRSLVALRSYLYYGLLRGRPFRTVQRILGTHMESPGTKAFTVRETQHMFSGLQHINITLQVTPYDVRYWPRGDHFLPRWVQRLIPRALGWFLIVQGVKPPSPLKG